jgi:hypothetical protein
MQSKRTLSITLSALIVAIFMASPGHAQEATTPVGTDIGTLYPDELAPLEKPQAYSPFVGKNYPMRLLWGDTHLHTANSIDAAAFGNTLGPEEAYRFARGEQVTSSTGQPAKLSRPLDFLVVADHAEGLGGMLELKKGNPAMMADPTLKRWHDMIAAGGESALAATFEVIRSAGTKTIPPLLADPHINRVGLAGLRGHSGAVQRAG